MGLIKSLITIMTFKKEEVAKNIKIQNPEIFINEFIKKMEVFIDKNKKALARQIEYRKKYEEQYQWVLQVENELNEKMSRIPEERTDLKNLCKSKLERAKKLTLAKKSVLNILDKNIAELQKIDSEATSKLENAIIDKEIMLSKIEISKLMKSSKSDMSELNKMIEDLRIEYQADEIIQQYNDNLDSNVELEEITELKDSVKLEKELEKI